MKINIISLNNAHSLSENSESIAFALKKFYLKKFGSYHTLHIHLDDCCKNKTSSFAFHRCLKIAHAFRLAVLLINNLQIDTPFHKNSLAFYLTLRRNSFGLLINIYVTMFMFKK